MTSATVALMAVSLMRWASPGEPTSSTVVIAAPVKMVAMTGWGR